MIKTVLIDDEPLARSIVKEYLQSFPEISIAQECNDGFEGLKAIAQHKPDLVFLDIQMPKINGFEMLELIEQPPAVIFTTAFDEYAIKAFESRAIDYLLKPFGEDRVAYALERVRTFLAGKPDRAAHQDHMSEFLRTTREPPPSCLLVKRDGRVLVLRPRDIDWIEAVGDYVTVHVGTESHLTRSTLSDMQKRLAVEGFVRVHRSRLVNLAHVREFRPSSRSESTIILKNGARLEASYALLKEIQERLGA